MKRMSSGGSRTAKLSKNVCDHTQKKKKNNNNHNKKIKAKVEALVHLDQTFNNKQTNNNKYSEDAKREAAL